MPQALRASLASLLLLGPTALAFFAGGYFDTPRLIAGIVVWLVVAAAVFCEVVVIPRNGWARLALAGLAGLTLLTGLSLLWAPIAGDTQAALQRLLLYLGALAAGTALLRRPFGLRLAEPVLAGGALVVIGYGLAGRLLPGLVPQTISRSAFGRLEQPLTYWNAVGLLAAVGIILAVRVAGDASRGARLRAAAAAATVPLGLGVYLTFSRGALLALGFGLVLLVLFTRDRGQLRSIVVAVAGGIAVGLVAGAFHAVRTGSGGAAQERGGALVLAALLVLAAAAGLAQWRWAGRGHRAVRLPVRPLAIGLGVIVLGGFLLVAATSGTRGGQPRLGADSRRLASLESNRYDYWKVAADVFADHPLIGDGAASFRVEWRRERTINDPALDTHSLYLQTAAELGLAGLVALALFLLGVAGAARVALRADREGAVGAVVVVSAIALHAALDWDWEMPAVALIALLLAAGLMAAADEAPPAPFASAAAEQGEGA